MLWPAAAWGQRQQFPSTIPAESPFSSQQPAPVMLDGTIQAEQGWDPYADPGAQQPGYLPQDCPPYGQPQGPVAGQRLLQQVKFEYTWLAGENGDDFDINTLELNGTFAIPFSYAMAPVLITPGFAVHYWEGPDASVGAPSLPPRVYDAYVDIGWRPQLAPNFSLDLGVRPGLYTDFDDVDSESIRIQGRALGIFAPSPTVQIVAGVLYVDRNDLKLLPAGGVIWTPNEDTRYEILFPRPKLAQRLSTIGNTDWWVYVAGEFGGGSWSIEQPGARTVVDYSDLRVILGLEWITFTGLKGYFEAGYVFERELDFQAPVPDFDPDETFMLRAGIVY